MLFMDRTSDLRMHSSRPGYLAEVTLALLFIRDTRASGRLSLRNGEHFGIAHLYFNEARLIHVTGDKRDAECTLNDVSNWTKGSVRFDAGLLVTFENLTWQQAHIFGRWLAFLELRGIMQGIAHTRLDGLTRSLIAQLPGEPIALPDEVEYYEEYEAEARARQWQRINEGARQLVARTLSEEQREQLKQVTLGVHHAVLQAGEVTQDLARRASKAAQESLQRSVESVVEITQEVARQGTQRAEELMHQTLNLEKRQQIIQSMQETVESVKQSVGQKVEQAISQATSPLPPELQARSIRYRSTFRTHPAARGHLSEGQ
jgi:hypothetical protein